MNLERMYCLAWLQVSGVGSVLLQRIRNTYGNLEIAWNMDLRDLQQVEGVGTKLIEKIAKVRSTVQPEQFYEKYLQKNPNFWTMVDSDYPQLLLEIPNLPPILHYRGVVKREELQGKIPLVAIVGTREPTPHGRKWARRLAQLLTKAGFTIISGLALGIDRQAHEGSLAVGGRTIAVMGTGVDEIYPPSHGQLYHSIEQNGLILSEYPAGTKPQASNFPPRNRIIAGLSRAVLVIEAPEKSGALITARYANEYGRDVYALPNSPDIPEARGALKLIHDGAEIIITEQKLLENLGSIPHLNTENQLSLPLVSPPIINQSTPSPLIPTLSPELNQIYQVINNQEMAFDLIVQSCELSAGEVSAGLLQLELLGLVEQGSGMRYSRT